jgi:cysteinylglycine-S-conjugate dipeptidase
LTIIKFGEFMSADMSALLKHVEDNFQKHLDMLCELTRIPSCSWKGFDPKFVEESAKKTKEYFDSVGLENVEVIKIPNTHPYVYADWLHAGIDKPTVLLYAHHDIQPPMREELWESPIHEPTIRGGRIYARGIADDKAGIMIHVASVAAYLETVGHLPLNVKIIIEGEEEDGSNNLTSFLEQYSEKLRCNTMILTDCSNFDTGVPALTTSLRGLLALEVEIKVMKSPLHSGMFGGPIPDPITAMSKMIASLTDEQGRLDIPEIYEMIDYASEELRSEYNRLPIDNESFKKQINMKEQAEIIGGEAHVCEKMWRLPSFAVNSIESGSRKLAGNVIMDSCWAKLGLRVVPNINIKKAEELLKKKIKDNLPWGLELEIKTEQGTEGWVTSSEHDYFHAAKRALTEGYGKEAVIIGCGGTIPFVAPLSEKLGGIPALLVGIEDPYCNAHSENESLDLSDFKKAIRAQVIMFQYLADEGIK